ncbi:L-glyceraldehyde 3-phosphate reductase [Parabacteroides sp. PM5-20]|uniref:aldo/keto reductase n=1 Tax=Parabacteroides sp. PM5-20 TaxID=2940527 RepID=UPI002475AF2D|nr:aldo/keto reductase [Parabacteroides sp. PM5-20]MDH6534217.1 L-glyceraldehyde 3-phosphate reductase [Parabacteroides sp. PM5-20]
MEIYQANENRYTDKTYRRCGRSGVLLPSLSLGLWHNFGSVDVFEHFIKIAYAAFDNGVTHFDLANNYGPVYGSAEENFGRILRKGLGRYRDELFISTKAGYDMWPGPYGNWGSRKYLMASLDQSLKRMGLDYVDIFYSHRPDPETPIEETMRALADMVRQGKALYVGISNYNARQTREALALLKEERVPCLLHQARYSMFDRWTEPELLPLLAEEGVGLVAFSPLAQGLLTDKYLHGIPADSRAAKSTGHLQRSQVSPEVIEKVKQLHVLAQQRGQTLAEMALAWLLKDERVTSLIIGVRSVEQLMDNLHALHNLSFTSEELQSIETILSTP